MAAPSKRMVPCEARITPEMVRELKAQNYFDLTLTAKAFNKFNFRVGVNNILDRDPPVAGGQVIPAGFGNGNTFPQVYDALGRYFFAGVTFDF